MPPVHGLTKKMLQETAKNVLLALKNNPTMPIMVK